jgi:hypothetical protein
VLNGLWWPEYRARIGMENIEKRYEKRGSFRPCSLNKTDLLELTALVQETFAKPEIERYFRVSTNLGNTRVFSNSVADFFSQKDLPDQISELSFWIEGWDKKNRFDKVVLLDFSKYSIQLSVEGIDPVWVYDKYNKIGKFLKSKSAWYWPMIMLEKFIIFFITLMLISSIIISKTKGEITYYFDELLLFGLWLFLIFYDTRKVWPYANIRITRKSMFTRENVAMALVLLVLSWCLLGGTILPLFK